MSTKRVGYLGATQVGKTSMLATALFGHDPGIRALVKSDVNGSVNRHLFDVHRRLMNNQWVPPTSANITAIPLGPHAEPAIELIDIRGGFALEMQSSSAQDLVRSVDAMAFLVEYDGPDSGNQLAAVEAALLLMGDKPRALALTKCERSLPCEAAAWHCPTNWLRETPLWAAHSNTLGQFEGCAWPTSAFGYDVETGLPAIILGEMGQLLPYRIQPRNVAKPLTYLLHALGCL